jgi:TonB family protein
MALQPEDRRFRRILAQVLVIGSVIGAVIPTIRVPVVEPEQAVDLPPRIVRIITDRIVTAAPAPVKRKSAAPQAAIGPGPEAKREPEKQPEPAGPRVAASPREKAARAGVLAMSDALVELRNHAPEIATPGSTASVGDLPAEANSPSVLVADVTRGSAGIDGGVKHESVLGAAGLPPKADSSGRHPARAAGTVPLAGGSKPPQGGPSRSEEEIQEILDSNKSAMYRLYNRQLRQDPALQGKTVVTITIAPSGEVTRCSISYSELDSTSLEKQLIRLIKRIDFGSKPGVPTVTTRVPIEFFPQ